jgi:glycosyltransferase involved in cell wall biosynthesis
MTDSVQSSTATKVRADSAMRVLVVQYAGDLWLAHDQLAKTGQETYYGHRYMFEQLERVHRAFGTAGIMCCLSGRPYETRLENGVTLIGADSHPEKNFGPIAKLLDEFSPTHLIVLGPLPKVIRWGTTRKLRVLCIFADSFNTGALRRFLRYGRLAKLLNEPSVEWVANHGVNACGSLLRIGVDRRKLIAWDWPHPRQPNALPSKTLSAKRPCVLLYVGAVQRQKGVGDAIHAVSLLSRQGIDVMLKVAGSGDIESFKALADRLGVSSKVTFLGLIANDRVLEEMRSAQLVVVPSRHAYPEGLPLTIYEALSARTPIIASDHPMFAHHLVHKESALIYSAGKPAELAARVTEVLGNAPLYARLSESAQGTWERLQNPLKWGDLIFHWLSGGQEDEEFLKRHRFAMQ